MSLLSYRRHRFPPEIIQHAIWLYLRFTLSYRDVEELFAERGVEISYETVRRWVLKFGPVTARRLRQRRPQPSNRWHLDEMVVRYTRSTRGIAAAGHLPPVPKHPRDTTYFRPIVSAVAPAIFREPFVPAHRDALLGPPRLRVLQPKPASVQ
jgi:hypothetical protein